MINLQADANQASDVLAMVLSRLSALEEQQAEQKSLIEKLQEQNSRQQNEIDNLKIKDTSQREQISRQKKEIEDLKIKQRLQQQYNEKLENRITAGEETNSKEEIMSSNVSAATPEVRGKSQFIYD